MSQAVSLEIQDVQRLGDDLRITGRPVGSTAAEPAPRKD
jgi:hypothetical protein